MAIARAVLLSVASASSLAVRSRVPLSQPLRAASVRMMASAADDPAAFVKSTVGSDKVAPPPQPPSLAPASPLPAPLPAPLPRRSRAHRAHAARRASHSATPASASHAAQVVVFSKTTCPFCRRTKDLFDGLDVKYTSVGLDGFNTHPKP